MRVRTAPGEILLEEFMRPLGLSGSALARQLKAPASRINDIVRGRREISADTALRLASYFGTTPASGSMPRRPTRSPGPRRRWVTG